MMNMGPFLVALVLASISTPAQSNPHNMRTDGNAALLAAAMALLPGPDGSPSTREVLTPGENLRRQRLSVARNVVALKMLRTALEDEDDAPGYRRDDSLGEQGVASYRALVRQLRQEAEVRFADGDAVGALDSHLTGIELGVSIGHRAPLSSTLVEFAVEEIARTDIEKVAERLDAKQCHAAISRLQHCDKSRSTLTECLEAEKAQIVAIITPSFLIAREEELPKDHNRDESIQALRAITPEWLGTKVGRAYDDAIEKTKLTYQASKRTALPPLHDRLADVYAGPARNPILRFAYERNLLRNRFLEAALQLRAIRLETGRYPAAFESQIDPFGDGSRLVYKRVGNSYLLYSIGPDGKDDGGKPIEINQTRLRLDVPAVANRYTETSLGDVVATVL